MQLDVEVSPPANIINTIYCMQYHLLANLCMLWHFPHCKWPYNSTGFGKCHQIQICPPLDREKEMHMSLLGELHKWTKKMTMIKGWICGVTALQGFFSAWSVIKAQAMQYYIITVRLHNLMFASEAINFHQHGKAKLPLACMTFCLVTFCPVWILVKSQIYILYCPTWLFV